MTPPDATALATIEAIKRLKARYCLVLDSRDWDGYRELFTPDAEISGVMPLAGEAGESFGREQFVAAVRRTLEPWTTFHVAHPQLIEPTGAGTARGLWVYTQSGFGQTSGYYEERYIRGTEGWRIAAMRITMVRLHSDDDPHLRREESFDEDRRALMERWTDAGGEASE